MRTLFIEDRNEIEKIMTSCKTCYLAMAEDNLPYVLPMNFALDGDSVILHSAQSGRMWEILQKNPNVCINWTLGEELKWQDVRVGCSYRVKSKSVLVEGEALIIDDYDEKYRLLEVLMRQYSDRKFKFNKPAVKNVGIIKVKIKKLTAKEFGAKAVTPWNS
ncbi:MAG: pyridoxamine 5'-phosphate oxidase family protein [Prolixibacteraceae bacterium]|nr:pyridoxamine 5'-phosphate oxidase family protein [Prolixibacteraceae bacterium]